MNRHVVAYLAATLIALILSSAYLLDGPSELEAATAVQADLSDAIAMANTKEPTK